MEMLFGQPDALFLPPGSLPTKADMMCYKNRTISKATDSPAVASGAEMAYFTLLAAMANQEATNRETTVYDARLAARAKGSRSAPRARAVSGVR
jgi:hypothetical protein